MNITPPIEAAAQAIYARVRNDDPENPNPEPWHHLSYARKRAYHRIAQSAIDAYLTSKEASPGRTA